MEGIYDNYNSVSEYQIYNPNTFLNKIFIEYINLLLILYILVFYLFFQTDSAIVNEFLFLPFLYHKCILNGIYNKILFQIPNISKKLKFARWLAIIDSLTYIWWLFCNICEQFFLEFNDKSYLYHIDRTVC